MKKGLLLLLAAFILVVIITDVRSGVTEQKMPTFKQGQLDHKAIPQLSLPSNVTAPSTLQPAASFLSPVQGNPRGLAYDGTYLYITNFSDGDEHKIYKVDPANGLVVAVINVGPPFIGSLAYDCSDGTFWAGDYNCSSCTTWVYHFNAAWQFISSFPAPEVNTALGGVDGLTVAGGELYVSGDLDTRVHRYTKAGAYLGVFVNYGWPRVNSGLAFDGTSLYAVFTEYGFITNGTFRNGYWLGFRDANFIDNFYFIDHDRPRTGFIEDLEFPCGDPSTLWAHGYSSLADVSIILMYNVGVTDSMGLTACSDGIDNDCDGCIDYPADPGCTNPSDEDEGNANCIGMGSTACSDGIDNDGDGCIDYPADPGCTSLCDDFEGDAACGGGVIPTLSEWGLIFFAAFVLTLMTWVYLKRTRSENIGRKNI